MLFRSAFYRVMEQWYEAALAWCLRHRLLVIGGALLILVGGFYLLTKSPLEFVVDDDMSEFEVLAEAPPGSSLERSTEIARTLEGELRKIPEVRTLFTTIGVRGQYLSNVTDISMYVGLTHLSERRRTQDEIKQDARRRLAAFPGLRISAQQIDRKSVV